MSSQFAYGQLLKALETAEGHQDAGVRKRAAQRADAWRDTVRGMADGSLSIGSRVPVKKFPPWVTLQVGHGGFATGRAVAADVDDSERQLADKLLGDKTRRGSPSNPDTKRKGRDHFSSLLLRQELFSHYLSDAGLAELNAMLDTGAFTANAPEEMALLTIAWLLRAGDSKGALQVIDAITPFATALRFAPVPALPAQERAPIGYAWRRTAKEASDALRNKRVSPDIEQMRVVLKVWNPLSDRFLALWSQRMPSHGSLDDKSFDEQWMMTARALLEEYDAAVAEHGNPSRKRRNLSWLVDGTREAVRHGNLTDRINGRVRIAVTGMIAKRGAWGSASLTRLRERQKRVANIPSHRTLGVITASRIADTNTDLGEGIQDPESYGGPITSLEAQQHNVPEGQLLPLSLRRVLWTAHAAPLDVLLSERLIPSAEIYAALLPRDVRRNVLTSYSDLPLGRVMAANYAAFARRRSLLLLNYEHQVRISELPWVAATEKHRVEASGKESMQVLRHAAKVAIQQWPGTIVPNPFIAQLSSLAVAAGVNTPFVEELAADIFMGDFSSKFSRAANIAAKIVAGTLYAKYYSIDTNQLARSHCNIGRICQDRIDDMKLPTPAHRSYVVQQGEVIEQGQILTTHNLATFVSLGVTADWYDLAVHAWKRCCRLLWDAAAKPHPLGTIKNAAYAWRQALFFLSMAEKSGDAEVTSRFMSTARENSTSWRIRADGRERVPRLDLVLNGLKDVLSGSDSAQSTGRTFLGWSRGPHWILMTDKQLLEYDSKRDRSPTVSVSEWETKLREQYSSWDKPT